jgi:hypothetical protein
MSSRFVLYGFRTCCEESSGQEIALIVSPKCNGPARSRPVALSIPHSACPHMRCLMLVLRARESAGAIHGDTRHTLRGNAENLGGAERQIKAATFDEWTAIGDPHRD